MRQTILLIAVILYIVGCESYIQSAPQGAGIRPRVLRIHDGTYPVLLVLDSRHIAVGHGEDAAIVELEGFPKHTLGTDAERTAYASTERLLAGQSVFLQFTGDVGSKGEPIARAFLNGLDLGNSADQR